MALQDCIHTYKRVAATRLYCFTRYTNVHTFSQTTKWGFGHTHTRNNAVRQSVCDVRGMQYKHNIISCFDCVFLLSRRSRVYCPFDCANVLVWFARFCIYTTIYSNKVQLWGVKSCYGCFVNFWSFLWDLI